MPVESAPRPDIVPAANLKINILVIDDDDVDRMALGRALKMAGVIATLHEATDSESGWSALQEGIYDCVFLDYQLPDGNGLTLLRKLRSASIEVPVVMMTGQGDEQLVVDMLHAGASDYLPKARITPDTLSRILNNALRLYRAETERREAQRRLTETSARLQYLIDNSPSIIYSAVPSGDFKMTFVSENLFSVLGFTPEEMLHDSDFWFNHIHPDDRQSLLSQLPRFLSSGLQQAHDYRFRHRDGHYLWMHDSMRIVHDKQGCAVEILGSLQDISARKQLEETLRKEKEEQQALNKELQEARGQLLQNEKMAAIGLLAAGVAHEINNPIGFINSNLVSLERYVADLVALIELYQNSEKYLEPHPAIMESLKTMREQIDLEYIKQDIPNLLRESQEGVVRVKKIVQDLKDFSHVDKNEWQETNLHQGLDSTLNIVNNEIKYKAEVHKEYGSLPMVECLASQINQVFMNLLVNAAHAITNRGLITIRTGQQDSDVWVEITDTGVGIPADGLKRIFDPFYTTKPIGIGTGLGLSVSHKIICKHHGRIEVESDVGKGTTFRIWLPISQQSAEVSRESVDT